MIIVNEFNRACNNPDHELTAEQKIIGEKLLIDMERMKAMCGDFDMGPIKCLYSDWYLEQAKQPPFQDERFDGYFNRRQVHLLKLCQVMSASRSDEMVILPDDFNRALDLLEETEKKMFYAFRGVGESELIRATDRVIETIRVEREVTYHDLLRKHYRYVSHRTLDDVLEQLDQMKVIRRTTNTEKRTQTIIWLGEGDEDQR